MYQKWLEGNLLSVKEIQNRLKMIFPREIDINGYITREMGAKTIFAMLYCFCVETEAWIRPATITCMTDAQAMIQDVEKRKEWLKITQSAKAPRDIPERWYKPNTREPIRDETLRELVRLNAVQKREGLPVTSPLPQYALRMSFAELFDPTLQDAALTEAVEIWKNNNLSAAALAKTALLKRMVLASTSGVLVQLPNGETRKMAYGPSSELAKAVVEQFAQNYMKEPAVLMMSESGHKLFMKDDDLCQAVGFHIDTSSVLPDLILAELGGTHPIIIFVECVASDGPINDRRKQELTELAETAGFSKKDYAFVTVFRDRADAVSRKLFPSISWGTFVWYASEPDNIIYLREGMEQRNVLLTEFLQM